MISYLSSIFKRFLLFQFFFVFAYYKFLDLSKSSYEFKDKFYDLSKFFSFRNPQVDLLFNNPIPAFQGFIGVQLICALFAVLGSRFFSFISGLFLLLSSLIYYGPLNNKLGGVTGKFLLESCSMEFFLCIALVLAIFAHSFRSGCKNTKDAELEPEVTVRSKHDARDSKPSSKKEKKRL